jgi:acetolactate decarboxylase
MPRSYILAVAAVLVLAGTGAALLLSANPGDEPDDTLYQIRAFDDLLIGNYGAADSVGSMLEHGDTGIGGFAALDGEMIIVDGECYRATVDGKVTRANATDMVGFAQLTSFSSDGSVPLDGSMNMSVALTKILGGLPTDRAFYVVTVHGTFDSLTLRSVPGQQEPYPPLSDVVANQTVFHYTSVQGTLVGIWSPNYTATVSCAGWHFHFISDDRTKGGHCLDLQLSDMTAQWDQTLRYETVMIA